MQPQFTINPLPRLTRVLDWLLLPVMHVVTGTFYVRGKPQQTHRWHIQPVHSDTITALDKKSMVEHCGDYKAAKRYVLGLPMCHIPILGGWRVFVVVIPVKPIDTWHIGWSTKDSAAINRLPLHGVVRMMVGPEKVRFFGICAKTGMQIPLRRIGVGRLWDRRYRKIPMA